MSVDWISKTADDNATRHEDGGIVAIGYADDALVLHMNSYSFELLVGLMMDLSCDLEDLPEDNDGEFVEGDIAREWARKLTEARPNIVLIKVWFPAEDTDEPEFNEILALAGTFSLPDYVSEINTEAARMANVMGREPSAPLDVALFRMEEVHLDDLEDEDGHHKTLVDQAITLLRDGDGFYQW